MGGRQWAMEDAEIARAYRAAANPRLMPRILAELNAVDLHTMRQKLRSLGFPVQEPKSRLRKIDGDRVRELAASGMALRDMADTLGCSVTGLHSWFWRNGVEPPQRRQ